MSSYVPEDTALVPLKDRLPKGRLPKQEESAYVSADTTVIEGGTYSPDGKDTFPFQYKEPLEPIIPEGYAVVDTDTQFLDRTVVHVTNPGGISVANFYRKIATGKIAYCRTPKGDAVMVIADEKKGDQQIPISGEEGKNLVDGLEAIHKFQRDALQDHNELLANVMTDAIDRIKGRVPVVNSVQTLLREATPVTNIALKIAAPSPIG